MLSIITSLADEQQSNEILSIIEQRWDDLVAMMPMKICYPAIAGRDWQTTTGWDRKNLPWSYHNAGSWPMLLWLLTAAAQKMGKLELAEKASVIAGKTLAKDNWPEYYDGKQGRLIGREARHAQTWTIAGYISAQYMLADPEHLSLLSFDQEAIALTCDLSPKPMEGYTELELFG